MYAIFPVNNMLKEINFIFGKQYHFWQQCKPAGY